MKPAKVKRLVRRDVQGWRGCLGLGEWQLSIGFERMDAGIVATCQAKWEYHEARLAFDAHQMAARAFDRDELRRTVLHELLHCVCNGYERFHEDALLEELVSKLTCITLRCWNAPAPEDAP